MLYSQQNKKKFPGMKVEVKGIVDGQELIDYVLENIITQ